MPQDLIQAFLAAEDRNFFSHVGLSWRGIIRSIVVNIVNRKKMQGASTITQQLVKLLFFHSEKTFKRKIKEQIYALLIEQQCTKEQILQTYLNNVYFGCGIYGVEAACQRFWGISACDISLDQAALLAAIIRSPGNYSPLLQPQNALRLRNRILQSMQQIGFICQTEYEHAVHMPLQLINTTADDMAPHLKEVIRQQLEELVGKRELYTGGLIIQTTLSADLQKKAQTAFKKQIAHLRETSHLPIDGALISFSHQTGEIKACIGGYDFQSSKYNRALQAKRQVGSIVKPIIYAKALHDGKTFADTAVDEPLEISQGGRVWQPQNHDETFKGEMTLAYALSHSNNIIAIKTLLQHDPLSIINLIHACGIDDDLQAYPSFALGCFEASLIKALPLFSIFANDGIATQPHFIRWVKDRWGNKIYKTQPSSTRVLSSKIAGQVNKVLQLGMNRVRALYNDPIVDANVISKTGTTNEWRTCWFMGATPDLTTGIYIGCDNNNSLGKNMFPLHTAFPIWKDIYCDMQIVKKQFTYDPSLKEVWIDKKTGAASQKGKKRLNCNTALIMQ